jgi:curved DNA-binding protein CbpA
MGVSRSRRSADQPGTVANHYAALGVWADASQDEIKSTYRRLVGLHHPDAGGRPARFLEIQAAYDVLGDPAARRRYDTSLRPREKAPETDLLPALPGERDRPSLKSVAALGFGGAAMALLLGGLVLEQFSTLPSRTLVALRLGGFVLGLAGAKLAHSELAKLGRLRELHGYGIRAVVELPEPSRASRTAARCGWMLGRAAPVGFVLLTLAAALQRIQPLLDTLRSLQGFAP